MPIYEYLCSQCGKRFDVLQAFSAEPLEKCIHCQGRVCKLASAPAFQFKGKGFYITDYKKSPAAGAESPAATPPPPEKKEAKGQSDAH
jgi:putative FmdB family regulatory protein